MSIKANPKSPMAARQDGPYLATIGEVNRKIG
jgi:hypothetical protein